MISKRLIGKFSSKFFLNNSEEYISLRIVVRINSTVISSSLVKQTCKATAFPLFFIFSRLNFINQGRVLVGRLCFIAWLKLQQ